MAKDGQARIRELRERTLESMRRIRSQSLSLDEAEALGQLIEGRKTAVELAEAVYGLGKEDPGHDSSCVKMRRILKRLQQKGLVSTGMLGRNRPYRITPHGVAVLASITPNRDPPGIIRAREAAIFTATAICGGAMLAYSKGLTGNPATWLALFLFALFFALLGFSAALFLIIVGRVF